MQIKRGGFSMVNWVRRNGQQSVVSVDEVHAFSNEKYNGLKISWSGDIGFGEYTITFNGKNIHADSECMDDNNDKNFLKALLEDLVNQTIIDD